MKSECGSIEGNADDALLPPDTARQGLMVREQVPPHLSEAEVKAIAGEDAVYYGTKLSGASNVKAKRLLGWKPRRLEWLEK